MVFKRHKVYLARPRRSSSNNSSVFYIGVDLKESPKVLTTGFSGLEGRKS